MNAEEVEGTTQTKCCEGECGERELEQPSAWWIPMNHCSTVFFNPLLLAIEYPTALNVLDRCLRFPQSEMAAESRKQDSAVLLSQAQVPSGSETSA